MSIVCPKVEGKKGLEQKYWFTASYFSVEHVIILYLL